MSAAIGAMAVLATLMLWVVTDFTVRTESRASLQRSVDTDVAGLTDIYAAGGQAALVQRISDRLSLAARDGAQTRYLVVDDSGRRLAGDMAAWPGLAAATSDIGIIRIDGGAYLARATQLDARSAIIVAKSLSERDALLSRLGMAFAIGGLVIFVVALAAGWFLSKGVQSRVLAVSGTYRAIEGGDLDARTPVTTAPDEIDELIALSNAMLDRMAGLAQAHRDVSNHLAHEVRTPLQHLDHRLIQALNHEIPPALSALLTGARSDIRAIVAMLESLLDIAASTAGRGDKRGFVTVDLSDLAAQIADLYAPSAEEFDLVLEVAITADQHMAGDPMLLMRMMTNLLDNAFKYTQPGGRVSLQIAPGPQIIVADNGPGVPEAQRTAIFDRFARGTGAGSAAPGHGLGLALALAIAERHGMTIAVEDNCPGARFVVRRPL